MSEDSPRDGGRTEQPPLEDLRVPAGATSREAAAITAALDSYLREERDSPGDSGETWDGKRFAFAGRTEALTGIPRRVPRGAPTDKWTAAGRADRFER